LAARNDRRTRGSESPIISSSEALTSVPGEQNSGQS
jgi:hypothetical protein